MPDGRHADPIRDRHIARLRESGLTVDAIAERTGLAKRTVLQRFAAIMKKGGATMPSADQLSQRLVELRRLGMHDGEIADATELSRALVWRYRNGIASRPGWDSVQAIERVYEQRCRDQEK